MAHFAVRFLTPILCGFVFATLAIAESEPFKIGFLTDLSGPGAFWGRQSRIGVLIAEDELRVAKVNVQVVFGDSGLDTKRSLSEVQKLLYVDKVDAVVTEFAAPTNATYPVISGAKKLMVGSCAARKFLDAYPSAFKTFLEYEKGCREVAQQWKARGAKTVGLLKVSAEFGEWCEKGLREVYPDATIMDYSAGENVASQILSLKGKGVAVLFHTGFEGDGLNALKELRLLRWQVPVNGCASDLFTENTLHQYPKELENGMGFGYRKVDEDFIKKVLVKDSSNSLFGVEAAANAYIMIKEMARALSSCPRTDLQCQSSELSKAPAQPLLGFNGFKDRIADFDFMLYAIKDGRIVEIPASQNRAK